MADLGSLRREIDRESAKIRLALLKCEVRVELKNLPQKESELIVSTLRKIYISVYEKLYEAMQNAFSKKKKAYDLEMRNIRQHWKTNWKEAKATLERLEEIVLDLESCTEKELNEDKLQSVIKSVKDVLDKPPSVFMNFSPNTPYNDYFRDSLSEDEDEASGSFYSAFSDYEDDRRTTWKYLDVTPQSRDRYWAIKNRQKQPVFRIRRKNYTLESDFMERLHVSSPSSSKSSINLTN